VCDDSDQPFDELKTVVGLFGKSKWQSYFELLCLPLEMQGLKPNIPMGKLKQSLLHRVSPDNDLFLAMFLIPLPPSMQEAAGSWNYNMASAMVRAAAMDRATDALWDTRSGHGPMIAATMTQRRRSPAPTG
jgi:hypothetical protein